MDSEKFINKNENCEERLSHEKRIKKKAKIFSDAFPPNEFGDKLKNTAISDIHKKISNLQIDENKIFFKNFTKNHLNEIKLLHKEWFPIDYDDSFFDKILGETGKQTYYTLGAFYKSEDESNQELILGGIFCEIKSETHLRRFISEGEMKKYDISLIDDILNFTPDYYYLYIMTIGVVDECRRLKLGTKLLKIVTDYFLKVNNLLGVYLHVVEYNKSAIQFYLKNEFIDISLVQNYYSIGDKFYNAKVFIKFFNSMRKVDNLGNKIFNNLFTKSVKLLIFILTMCMFCKCLRRKRKIF